MKKLLISLVLLMSAWFAAPAQATTIEEAWATCHQRSLNAFDNGWTYVTAAYCTAPVPWYPPNNVMGCVQWKDAPPRTIGDPCYHYYFFGCDTACPPDKPDFDYNTGLCGPASRPRPDPNLGNGPSCPAGAPSKTCGNPINMGTGNKFQTEGDIAGSGLLIFTRYYNSSASAQTHLLGNQWTNTYTRQIENLNGTPTVAVVTRPDSRGITFNLVAGVWQAGAGETAQLQRLVDSNGHFIGWTFQEKDGREVENYDTRNRLTSIVRADGTSVTAIYNNGVIEDNANDGQITSVTAQDGRKLQFAYTASRLSQITDPSGAVYAFAFDGSGRLQSVTYPGGTSKTYLYNEPAYTTGADLPNALTGIVDEKGQRFATFNYQADGRAVSTEHAGGADKYSLVYNANGTTSVTEPSSSVKQISFVSPGNVLRASSSSVTANGQTRTTAVTYDSNSWTDLATDAAGTTTDYDHDSRGLLTQQIDSANKPATKRTTQTTWSATFRVPTDRRLLDASGVLVQRTTWSYNARGQQTAVCNVDPGDSTAMAFVCGNSTNAPAKVRQSTTTYCEQVDVTAGACPRVGLVISTNGPRTDVTDVTTYTYYASDDATCSSAPTACPHRKGDLWKTTNSIGQVTEVLAYDGASRVLSVKDANGVITDLTYWSRGWLKAKYVRGTDNNSTTDDAITQIDYDVTGQTAKVTQPDNSYVSLTYDQAHRLTDVTDAQNNSIHYSLDNAGNRFQEATKDAGNVVKRSLSRLYDTLGQLQTQADAYSYPSDYTYDLNGNRDTTTDSLLRVTDNDVDPLNRLVKVIANTGGGASDKATTEFTYDARDNMTSVKDPKSLFTNYAYDGLNNLGSLSSPDTGLTTYGYNAAGQRTSQADARPKLTSYGYDALGRMTSQTVPTATQNVTFTYDTPAADCVAGETFGIGRLARITDESGSTRYCYDRRGNLVRKVQTVVGGTQLTVGATYDAAGHISAMTYPSGAIVTYVRNANGQITSVGAVPVAPSPQVTLVSAASYLPFGPLTTLTFGNGRVLTKTYDQNYGIDMVSDNAATNPLSEDLTLNAVGSVTGLSERTNATTVLARSFTYDGLDRMTAQKNGASSLETFTYNSTGDRLSKSATTYAYTSTPANHWLTAVGGTARTYDLAGNTTVIGSGGSAKKWTYDDRNRMRDFKINNSLKASYRYNGKGERVLKTDAVTSANSEQFVYDEAGHLLGEYTTAGARIKEYVWMDDTLVAILCNFDSSTYQYVETDHLGTPRAVVHSNPTKNVIIWRWDSNNTAFGEHAPNGNPDGDSLSYTLNLRYPGQFADAESGLNYNYFRDYEPGTGRYVESDPVGLKGGPSTYAYAFGGPLDSPDPLGLSPDCRIFSAPGPLFGGRTDTQETSKKWISYLCGPVLKSFGPDPMDVAPNMRILRQTGRYVVDTPMPDFDITCYNLYYRTFRTRQAMMRHDNYYEECIECGQKKVRLFRVITNLDHWETIGESWGIYGELIGSTAMPSGGSPSRPPD